MSEQAATCIQLFQDQFEGTRNADRTYLLYFIPGNPGLIEYYRTFLTHLFGLLTSSSSQFTSSSSLSSVDFEIHGRSLYGFECDHGLAATRSKEDGRVMVPHPPPYNVKEQIALCQMEIEQMVRDAQRRGKKDVRVILMGHSFGTYMALEIMRRLRDESEKGVRVVGGALLFATVVDIAKSPKGVQMSPLLSLPFLPTIASLIPYLLTPLPTSLLTSLISTLLSMPPEAAHASASFIKSPHGIQQCAHMAADEMKEITIDRWDEEIWGAAHESSSEKGWKRPVLRFLFGERDHWVADETRDELIRARGRLPNDSERDEVEEWKPVMEVDTREGFPHAFCIRHSVPVAEKVLGYISDIVTADLEA